MTESVLTDVLKKLVWFLITRAILGITIALVLNFVGLIPVEQAAFQAPKNYCGGCF
jgi:hypothetical protein